MSNDEKVQKLIVKAVKAETKRVVGIVKTQIAEAKTLETKAEKAAVTNALKAVLEEVKTSDE
jgi:hypothetical protein